MRSLDSLRGEEKEQEVVARVLSRFKPKEVRRRESNQLRRRKFIRTTTRDLLSEKLRSINLYNNEVSSSLSSPTPPRFYLSRTNLPQQQSKLKSLLEKCQEYAEKKQSTDDTKSEMILKSSSSSSSSMERNCYSKLLPFPSFGLNHQKLAPAVQIRSVIPVCSAPPLKPNNPFTRELAIRSQERCEIIELGLESKSRLNP